MSWDRRDTLAAIGLLLVPFAYFWRIIVPGAGRHYFESGDFVDQFYAFAHLEAASVAAGRLPLWNPYAFSGSPFWADVQAAVAYPLSLAVVLASNLAFGRLPFLALEIEAVAHLALAGLLMYLFVRRVVGCRSSAAVAALAFALGGYLTGYPILQLAVLESNAWLPLALLGVVVLAGSRPWAGMALVALAIGMGILAGHPQSALYLVVLTVAYALWRLWPMTFGAGKRGRTAVRPWLWLAGAVALGFGLSAAGWLPALEYTRLSNRAAADYATVSHGFPPRELVGVVLAGVTKWSPLYVGVLPLLLAAVAAARSFGGLDAAADDRTDELGETLGAAEAELEARRSSDGAMSREGVFWTLTAAVSLVLSLGGRAFLFDAFYLLAPGFDMFRGQERAAFLFSFSLAVLAGLGFAAWRRCDSGGMRCAADRVVLGGSLVLAALGVLVAVVAPPDLQSLGIRLSMAGGAAALLAAARSTGRLRLGVLTAGALALIALDLYLVGSTTNLQPGSPGELHASPVIEAMTQSDGFVRVQNDDRLPRNFGVLHQVESTYGASPMRPQAYDTLRDGLAAEHESRWRDVAAVSHVLSAEKDIGGPDVTDGSVTGDVGTLHKLEAIRPYAWVVPCAATIADENAALERLRDSAPERSSYLVAWLHAVDGGGAGGADAETERLDACLGPDGPLQGLEPPFDANAELKSRHPGAIEVRTSSTHPGWLVVSEGYYPGWRAAVDGEPVEVLRTNMAFMSVPIPEGTHEVRLWFTAPTVSLGLAISLLAAALLAIVIVAGLRGTRSATTDL